MRDARTEAYERLVWVIAADIAVYDEHCGRCEDCWGRGGFHDTLSATSLPPTKTACPKCHGSGRKKDFQRDAVSTELQRVKEAFERAAKARSESP